MEHSGIPTREAPCTKCGLNPKSSKHLWCRKCRNEYGKREYRLRESRAQRRGFLLGARAMQDAVIALLTRLADSEMNGASAAQLVAARLDPVRLEPARVPVE